MSPETWAAVRERLAGAGLALEGLDEQALRKALSPVMALARAAERYAPELLEKRHIRILVIGAEWLDALDSGRWYSLLGPLLGRPLSVEGYLVGPQLESGSLDSVNSLVAQAPAFERIQETLQQFLEGKGRPVDVAVVYQPGLDSDTALLEPPGPGPLLEAGIPVLGSSYSRDEFLMEREILRAFGYECAEPVSNPMALDLGREEARWGALLWALSPQRPGRGEPDREAVAEVQRLSRMLAHSKLQGMLVPVESLGESFGIARREGGQREMIYLFDSFYVARDSGEVFAVEGNALRPTEVRVGTADLSAYPDGAGLARALWAARLKEKYLIGKAS
jgi:hypothetical protein